MTAFFRFSRREKHCYTMGFFYLHSMSFASLVQREVAFSQENDGGIVKEKIQAEQSLSLASARQLPLHKGAASFSSILLYPG